MQDPKVNNKKALRMFLAGAVFMARSKTNAAHIQLGISPYMILFVAFVEHFVDLVLQMYTAYVEAHPLEDTEDQAEESDANSNRGSDQDHDHDDGEEDEDKQVAKGPKDQNLVKAAKLEKTRLRELRTFVNGQRNVCLHALKDLCEVHTKVRNLFLGAPSFGLFEEAFYKAKKKWSKLEPLLEEAPGETLMKPLEKYAKHMYEAADSMRSLGQLTGLPMITLNGSWDQIKFHSESIRRACESWRALQAAYAEQAERLDYLQELTHRSAYLKTLRRELFWQKNWFETLKTWYFELKTKELH